MRSSSSLTTQLLFASALFVCVFLSSYQQIAAQYTGETSSFLEIESLHQSQAQNEDSPPPLRDIKGRIKLNGVTYKTSCSCGDPKGVCQAPSFLRIHQMPFNEQFGLSKNALKAVLGPASSFEYIDAAHTSFACTDGRESRNVLATLGGDTAEFLMGLAVYEELADKYLTAKEIKDLLASYISNRDFPLYYCTDEAAIQHLTSHLRVGGAVGVVGVNIDNPPENLKNALLEDLVKVDNQGDLFLKALLAHPHLFYIRKELVQTFIKVLYQIFWDKATLGLDNSLLSSKISFNVYDGAHNEKAFINFIGSSQCTSVNLIPAFAPSYKGISVFVNHPQAVGVLRQDLSVYFSKQPDLQNYTSTDILIRLNRRGVVNFEEGVRRFGVAVPFYTVVVD